MRSAHSWTIADKWDWTVLTPAPMFLLPLARCGWALSMKRAPHYPCYCSKNRSYCQNPFHSLHISVTTEGRRSVMEWIHSQSSIPQLIPFPIWFIFSLPRLFVIIIKAQTMKIHIKQRLPSPSQTPLLGQTSMALCPVGREIPRACTGLRTALWPLLRLLHCLLPQPSLYHQHCAI